MKIKKPTVAAMEKRKATTDLNHENWDRDEEPEDKGTFQTASEDVLKTRVIKKAKRNISAGESGTGKSLFSGFSGFGSSASTVSAGSTPFSFLSKLTPTPPPSKTESPKSEKSEADTKFGFEKSNIYYTKLKGLNQSVSDWIKTHVDKNPLCILTPIFKDYEKYLKEIQEEKPEGTITSAATSTSFKFGGQPPKTDAPPKPNEKGAIPKFSFGTVNSTTDSKSSSNSIFGNVGVKPAQNDSKLSTFSFKPTQTTIEASSSKSSIFSNASSTSGESSAPSSVTGFSFSAAKPFTFGSNVTAAPPAEPKDKDEADEDEPPKVEFTPVVEDDSVYSKRCKVFVKHDGNYADRGIGTLYLKSVKDKDVTQLIVRADTNLGNILLNFILNESIPAQRLGKNNVMMVCIPTPDADPKPTSILLRVKTGEEADELLSTINKYKK